MSDFKDLRNTIILSSFGTASIGVILWFTPAKPLTNWVIAASVGGLISAEFVTGSAERGYKKKLGIFETEISKLNKNLDVERDLVDRQKQELASKDTLLANKTLAYNNLHQEMQQLRTILAAFKEELANKDNQIKKLQTANGEEATEVMQDSFQEFQEQLNNLILSFNRRYPNLQKDWEALKYELDSYINLFAVKVSTVINQTDASELITMSLAMQHEIISTGATLKVKAYKSIVTYLTREIEGVVFKEEHEILIEELNTAWQAKNQAIAQTYQKNFEAIKQEFAQVADSVVNGYREDFKSIVDEGMSQAEQIEKLQKHILSLQRKLEEASKPHRLPAAIEQSRVGNAIIDYYYRAGIVLDAIDWDGTETGYKLMFHVGRNGSRFICAEMLNANDAPQKLKEVSGAINTPEFKHNTRGGHMVLEVQTRHSKKKDTTTEEINKLWIPASKFESYVKRWERVRITAGSTGGKSPTAKNLALAIMNARQGQGTIKLYDPQHGSKKDYWDMPKAGTSHEDNVSGMSQLCDELDKRTRSPSSNHPFLLYIFDEIDSTIAQERENNGYYYFRDKVTYSLKQASHQNIGAIYIGQACDASTIPGMSWSDWNNAIQLHIGANAGVWLDKAKTVTSEDKTRLLEQYRKIQEYCDRMNEELGLDIFADATAYRFALAVPLTGLPKFIQLPDFDSYDYYEVMSTNTQNQSFSNNSAGQDVEVVSTVLDVKIVCPKCKSDQCKRNGKTQGKNQIQKYICKNCNHPFKETDVIN